MRFTEDCKRLSTRDEQGVGEHAICLSSNSYGYRNSKWSALTNVLEGHRFLPDWTPPDLGKPAI